jgi:hypothetical protein
VTLGPEFIAEYASKYESAAEKGLKCGHAYAVGVGQGQSQRGLRPGLAATAEVVLARSGREIAPTATGLGWDADPDPTLSPPWRPLRGRCFTRPRGEAASLTSCPCRPMDILSVSYRSEPTAHGESSPLGQTYGRR